MSYARYSREVRFDDLNNVHTFAVLVTPPGSRVLDLGAADGSVARVLAQRGCVVTAVERDAGAVDALAAAPGVTVVHADLERLPEDALPPAAFDVVLLLDVLEHLVDPAAVLGRALDWLAPGGRVVVSVPNVAHAAVRLAMLQGRFPRTDVGLLDRTHLQFFDETQLRALLSDAGLELIDLLTVDRDVHETEIDVDTSTLSPDVVAAWVFDALDTGPTRRLRPMCRQEVTGLPRFVATRALGDPLRTDDAWRPWVRRRHIRRDIQRLLPRVQLPPEP